MNGSYYQYAYHSGDIVVHSLAFPRGDGYITFNFLQCSGEHDDITIQYMEKEHPVKELIYEKHRNNFN